MVIASENFILRNYTEGDMEFLEKLLTDPVMMRFIGNGQPRDKSEIQEFMDWINRCYERHPDMGLKVILPKGSDRPVGHAGLVPQLVNGKEEIEIGYWISHEFWGRGYATEIAGALWHYGKNDLCLNRMISLIQKGNAASRKVAEKIGMKAEKEVTFKGKEVWLYSTD